MPNFIDYHAKLPPLPPEAVQQMKAGLGKKDEFGVAALNIFMSSGGQSWCYTEAPNADAVCKSHQAKGLVQDLGNVHQVQSLT